MHQFLSLKWCLTVLSMKFSKKTGKKKITTLALKAITCLYMSGMQLGLQPAIQLLVAACPHKTQQRDLL